MSKTKPKQNWKDTLIVELIIIILTIGTVEVISLVDNYSKIKQDKINQTMNASINAYWAGIYDIAYEQSKTGNIYFLNQSGGIIFNNIQDICKGVGK